MADVQQREMDEVKRPGRVPKSAVDLLARQLRSPRFFLLSFHHLPPPQLFYTYKTSVVARSIGMFYLEFIIKLPKDQYCEFVLKSYSY